MVTKKKIDNPRRLLYIVLVHTVRVEWGGNEHYYTYRYREMYPKITEFFFCISYVNSLRKTKVNDRTQLCAAAAEAASTHTVRC